MIHEALNKWQQRTVKPVTQIAGAITCQVCRPAVLGVKRILAMNLYFEALSSGTISFWYENVGDAIKKKLLESGYDCKKYVVWDEPDYRLDLTYEDKTLKVIVVVYEDSPIKGAVHYEEELLEKPVAAITSQILHSVSNIPGIIHCQWMPDAMFRQAMGWPPLAV
jgi:hypothetical protein